MDDTFNRETRTKYLAETNRLPQKKIENGAGFVIVVAVIVRMVWSILTVPERRRNAEVQSLFGKDQWWRRG